MLTRDDCKTRYCQLQGSVASQVLTSRKRDGVIKDGYCRIFALMECAVQSNTVVVIIMAILYVLFTPRAQSYCSGPWFDVVFGDRQNLANRGKLQADSLYFWKRFYYAKVPHGRISTALRGKLSKALEFRIGRVASPSRAFSVRLIRSLCHLSIPLLLSLVSLCLPLRSS
jgi:hypothetical protein